MEFRISNRSKETANTNESMNQFLPEVSILFLKHWKLKSKYNSGDNSLPLNSEYWVDNSKYA